MLFHYLKPLANGLGDGIHILYAPFNSVAHKELCILRGSCKINGSCVRNLQLLKLQIILGGVAVTALVRVL